MMIINDNKKNLYAYRLANTWVYNLVYNVYNSKEFNSSYEIANAFNIHMTKLYPRYTYEYVLNE